MKNSKSFVANVFSFGLFSNFSIIYFQSVLAASASNSVYSTAYLCATLLSMLAFLSFSSLKASSQIKFHLLAVALAAPGMLLLGRPALHTNFFLSCAGVLFLLIDLTCPGILQTQLAERITSSQFVFMSGRILEAQLLARAIGGVALFLLAKFGGLKLCGIFAAAVALAHLFFFLYVEKNWAPFREKILKDKLPEEANPTYSAFLFLWKNPLVRAAMLISVWGTGIKFLIDLALLQATHESSTSLSSSAIIFSKIQFINIACIYLFHKLAARQLLTKLSLSKLLSIVPVLALVCLLACFFFQNIYTIAILFLVNQAFARSVHVPAVRQLFLVAPIQLRNFIYQLSLLHISIATALISGGILLIGGNWGLENNILLMISLCLLIFFVITGLDDHFMRNLWSHFMQNKSGHWLGHTPLDITAQFSLSECGIEMPSPLKNRKNLSAIPKFSVALKKAKESKVNREAAFLLAYELAEGKAEINLVVKEHGSLLGSIDPAARFLGLNICFLSGLTQLRKKLDQVAASAPEEASYAKNLSELWSIAEKWNLPGFSCSLRRKIRFLLLHASREKNLSLVKQKIEWALKHLNIDELAAFVDILQSRRHVQAHELTLECLDYAGKGKVSLAPFFREFSERPYRQSQAVRQCLERIGPQFSRGEASQLVKGFLNSSAATNYNIWTGSSEREDALQRAIFLDEWLLDTDRRAAYVRDTIWEFGDPEKWKKRLLAEMHTEALKESAHLPQWRRIFAE